ncbi:MAG: ABC transporter ATP-binding protein [Verrucomicrobiales bacterium]|nr:ABC transporter ATP-binding protein [Verrucomicrobiales bacterium]MCP5526392.1 ABC transporter ATP-binding protein [Verrucomicrobiales bacterium]
MIPVDPPVLRAEGIHKIFPHGRSQICAVRNVSIALAPGEIVVLEGPSGSGKTTLLSILGCLLSPTSGRIHFNGQALDPRDPGRLAQVRRQAIGFVFQQHNLFDALTAVENVEYALNIRGQRGRAARREADALIEKVGLSHRRNAFPSDLSGGEQQRVSVARALSGDPLLVLADEPTASLDWQAGEQILGLLQAVARQGGRALMIVTHDPRVRLVADRRLILCDGELSEASEPGA